VKIFQAADLSIESRKELVELIDRLFLRNNPLYFDNSQSSAANKTLFDLKVASIDDSFSGLNKLPPSNTVKIR
jgi:hypothetical protein